MRSADVAAARPVVSGDADKPVLTPSCSAEFPGSTESRSANRKAIADFFFIADFFGSDFSQTSYLILF